jgi:beta-lactamase class A
VLLPPRAKAAMAAAARLAEPTPVPVPPLNTAGLREAILGITAASDGTYGVSIVDLTSGQKLDLNAAEPMNAASVNKLEILAALYHEVEAGRVHLDTTLTLTTANIQDYGTGVIRYQPLGTRYTLDQLATVLVEQSDNTASYMLAQYLGLATIDKLVAGWGLTSTVVGQEVSTPQDAARFMQLLYEGKLANGADTRQMLDYLSHTAFNDRIPAGLPAGIVVAHKIGTQVNVENDVALVQMPGRPYVLSIFAKDVTEANAVPVEQAISRTVYQYEQQAKDGS